MLDAEFNARLGDFGLARTVQQEGETNHSTQQLGIFLLEVACGRRPGNQNPQSNSKSNIVDWVWELYGKGQILDAVDPRLQQDDLNEEQMECVLKLGLACCHPNPNYRPSMRVALRVLTGETIPPTPPDEKPAFIWPATSASFGDDSDFSLHVHVGQLTPSTDLSGR
nr:TPA_asm: hypothetical protein HUJ06_000426 [Nelumbo nucifera]